MARAAVRSRACSPAWAQVEPHPNGKELPREKACVAGTENEILNIRAIV